MNRRINDFEICVIELNECFEITDVLVCQEYTSFTLAAFLRKSSALSHYIWNCKLSYLHVFPFTATANVLCPANSSTISLESLTSRLLVVLGILCIHDYVSDMPAINIMRSTAQMNSVDAATIYHESAGWRYLETSMKCLQYLIEGCGKLFNPYVTQVWIYLVLLVSHSDILALRWNFVSN